MQKEDIILLWIFLAHKSSIKLRPYLENIPELILKGKVRLHQLTGIDTVAITVLFNIHEIDKLW